MRNVFVSYAHRLDYEDARDFREKFGNPDHPERMVFSDRSLGDLGLNKLSDETIKDIYIRPKIRNSSVTIVLIGAETDSRWWVDWEIYYSMIKTRNNDRNGVIGILLPNKVHNIPKRLEMNREYCNIITMPKSKSELEMLIEDAYDRRIKVTPDFSMPLRVRNS